MNRRIGIATLCAFLAAAVPPQGVQAQTAPGLRDLVGARGSSAESELADRGYKAAGNKGAASLWWNASSRTCVSMYVDNGRVQSIQTASARDCGKDGGGGGGAAAAVAGLAAVGLIAALASHHKKTDNRHAGGEHDGEYERGYNDGLYGGHYDRNDSDAYHEGFMAGQAEADNRSASNSRFVRGAPPAAQRACARRGDDFLGVPSGSSVPVSVYNYGQGNYEITVASGHYRARCSVTGDGQVTRIDPY